MENFAEWILNELHARGWSPAELARQAGISKGSISNVVNENRKAGPEICLAIANALGYPPEKIFRLAGLLPEAAAARDAPDIKEAVDILRNLPPKDRAEALKYLRYLYQNRND